MNESTSTCIQMSVCGKRWVITKSAPSLQLLQGGIYFHSDHDTLDTVPYTGLAASTRAYAKIIDGVNKMTLSELR